MRGKIEKKGKKYGFLGTSQLGGVKHWKGAVALWEKLCGPGGGTAGSGESWLFGGLLLELRGHSQLGGGGTANEAHGGAGGGGSAQLLSLLEGLLWLLEGGTLDSLLVGEGLKNWMALSNSNPAITLQYLLNLTSISINWEGLYEE